MIFAIFTVSLVGMLPFKIPQIKKSEAGLSYLNCFSAGMFLAIALIHMMPESVEEYEVWALERKLEKPFPLPYCCMFIGYLIVLLVDRVIMHKFMHAQVGHHHHNEANQCVIEPVTSARNIVGDKLHSSQSHLPHTHAHTPETFAAHGHNSNRS